MGLIVVGVDHSDGAKAALRFALEEARLRRSRLRVVHAWHISYVGAGYLAISQPVLDAEGYQIRDAAEAALEATLDEAFPMPTAWRSSAASSRDLRPRFWSMNREWPTCWSWDRAATAASPGSCWGP